MSDGYEHTGTREYLFLVRDQITQTHTRHTFLLRAQNLFDCGIPNKLNLRVGESFILHDFRRAKFFSTMHHVNLRSITRQEGCFFHGGVAATHDH